MEVFLSNLLSKEKENKLLWLSKLKNINDKISKELEKRILFKEKNKETIKNINDKFGILLEFCEKKKDYRNKKKNIKIFVLAVS